MGLLFVDNEPKYRYLHKSDSVSVKRGLRFRNSQLLKDEERLQYLLELATLRRRGQASNSPYIRHIIRCFLLRIAQGYPDYNTARTAIMEVEEQEFPLTAQAIHELFVDVLQNDIKVPTLLMLSNERGNFSIIIQVPGTQDDKRPRIKFRTVCYRTNWHCNDCTFITAFNAANEL